MSEKKNIERLFQEKFKDFEAIPSPIVWDNIEAELKKKKKKRVIPLWFRLSGVAAILLVGFLIGDGIINNSPETNNGIVNQEEEEIQNGNGGKELVPMKNPIKSNEVVTEVEKTNSEKGTSSEDNSKLENPAQNKIGKSNSLEKIQSKNNAVAQQDNTENNSTQNSNATKKANDKRLFNSQKSKANTSLANQERTNKKKIQGNKDINGIITENTPILNDKNNAVASSGAKENEIISGKLPANDATNKKKGLVNQGIAKENEKQLVSSDGNAQKNDKTLQNKNQINKNANQNNGSQIAFDTKAFEKQKIDSAAVATVEPNPLEELLKEKEKKQQAVTETKVNRWQITSNVAPIYFSSASNGSPLDQQFADNSKSYEKNLSYGIGVNYALNKKWSVRGGVNKLTLGYNTNDIVYYAGLSSADARGLTSNNIQEGSSVVIIVEDNTASNLLSFDDVPGKKAGRLNQTMGYLEVPVELSYKIVDNKFGIELIGGMSTLFLNENNLSVVSPGMSTSIGKASNLNDVSFTSNIGIGFKYKFWKSFEANVEPRLKYQINTFSENAGGFKPYFIGLYSGISFNF